MDYIILFIFGFLTGLGFYVFHYVIFMLMIRILKSLKKIISGNEQKPQSKITIKDINS